MEFTVVAGGGGHSSLALGVAEILDALGLSFNVIHPGDPVSTEYFKKYENFVVQRPTLPMRPPSLLRYMKAYLKVIRRRALLGEIVISSGASLSFVVATIAKLLGKEIWNFEVPDRIVKPSQTPRVLKHISSRDFVSWEEQKLHYKKAEVLGGVITPRPLLEPSRGKYILISTGTTKAEVGFLQQLIDACEGHRVVVLYRGKGNLKNATVVGRYLTRKEYEEILAKSKLVITHPGYTAFEAAINYGKPVALTLIPGYKKGPSYEDAKVLARKLNLTLLRDPNSLDLEKALKRKPYRKKANSTFRKIIRKSLNE